MTKAVCAHSFLRHVTINPLCPSLPTWRKVVNVAILTFEAMYIHAFYQHWQGQFRISQNIISFSQNSIPLRIILTAFVSLFTPFYNMYAFFTKTGPSPFQLKITTYIKKKGEFEKTFLNQPWSDWENPEAIKKFIKVLKSAFDVIQSCPKNETSWETHAREFAIFYHALRQGKIISLKESGDWIFEINPSISNDYYERFYQNNTIEGNARELFNGLEKILDKFKDAEDSKFLKYRRYQKDANQNDYQQCWQSTPPPYEYLDIMDQNIEDYCLKNTSPYFKNEKQEHLPSEDRIHALGRFCNERVSLFEKTLNQELLNIQKTNPDRHEIWENHLIISEAFSLNFCYWKLAIWALSDFANIFKDITIEQYKKNPIKPYSLAVISNFATHYHIFRQGVDIEQIGTPEKPQLKYKTPKSISEGHSIKFYKENTYHFLARTLFNYFIDELTKTSGSQILLATPKFKKDLDRDSYNASKPVLK